METAFYRHKPWEYEAVEVAKILAAKTNGSMDLAPKWVRDAIFEGKLDFPRTAYAIVINVLPNVPNFGAARDYLMRSPNGALRICPPETLAEMYERVDEEAPAVAVRSEPIHRSWQGWPDLLADMVKSGFLVERDGEYYVASE